VAAGAEVASAFVTLVPSARGFGSGIEREIGGELDKTGKKAGERLGSGIGAAAKGPIVAALAGGALLGSLGGLLADARESAKIGALTAEVVKTTGGAAKITAEQVGDLATSISNKTGADDEAIQAGANLLLTFTKVRNEAGKGNDIFNQATKASLDLATALGTDTKGAALQIGKALNDPIKGVSALSRAGVSFTAQQKEQIKTLQKGGDTLGAQKIILSELSTQFGGAAEAAGTPTDRLRTTIGNLREEAGAKLIPIVDSAAVVLTDRLIPSLRTAADFVSDNSRAFKIAGVIVGGLVTGLLVYNGVVKVTSAVTKAYAVVQALLNGTLALNPIGLVVVALIAVGAALVLAYKRSETFRNIVNTAFAAIRTGVVAALTAVRAVVTGVFGFLRTFIGPIIGGYIQVIRGGLNIIRGIFTGDFDRIKTGVVQVLGGLVDLFKALPGRLLAALGNLGKTLLSAGGDLIRGLIDGITGKAGDLINAIKRTVTDRLPGFVRNALGINSPSRVFMEIGQQTGAGMALGIERSARDVNSAARSLVPAPGRGGFTTSTPAVTPGSRRGGRDGGLDLSETTVLELAAAIGRRTGQALNGVAGRADLRARTAVA
jgi:hypothetical protein